MGMAREAPANGISPNWVFFFFPSGTNLFRLEMLYLLSVWVLFGKSSGSEIIAVCYNWRDAGREFIQVESGAILGDLLRLAHFYQFQQLRCL